METIIKFIIIWAGALCGHILSLYSDNFKGTQPFLKQFFPDKKPVFYIRLDFIILPFIGAFLAYIIMVPEKATMIQELFAGLTWSGSITALLSNKR